MNPTIFPGGARIMDPDVKTLDRPKFRIVYHDKMQSQFSSTSGNFSYSELFAW